MSSQTTICAKRVCANAGRMNDLKLETSTAGAAGRTAAQLLTLKHTNDDAFGAEIIHQRAGIDRHGDGQKLAWGQNYADQKGEILVDQRDHQQGDNGGRHGLHRAVEKGSAVDRRLQADGIADGVRLGHVWNKSEGVFMLDRRMISGRASRNPVRSIGISAAGG